MRCAGVGAAAAPDSPEAPDSSRASAIGGTPASPSATGAAAGPPARSASARAVAGVVLGVGAPLEGGSESPTRSAGSSAVAPAPPGEGVTTGTMDTRRPLAPAIVLLRARSAVGSGSESSQEAHGTGSSATRAASSHDPVACVTTMSATTQPANGEPLKVRLAASSTVKAVWNRRAAGATRRPASTRAAILGGWRGSGATGRVESIASPLAATTVARDARRSSIRCRMDLMRARLKDESPLGRLGSLLATEPRARSGASPSLRAPQGRRDNEAPIIHG